MCYFDDGTVRGPHPFISQRTVECMKDQMAIPGTNWQHQVTGITQSYSTCKHLVRISSHFPALATLERGFIWFVAQERELPMCLGASIVLIKHHHHSSLGRKGFISSDNSLITLSLREGKAESQSRKWSRSKRNMAYWLVLHGLLSLFNYTTQNHLPRDSTTPSGLSSPLLIINKK